MQPLINIIRGTVSDEELAALTVAVMLVLTRDRPGAGDPAAQCPKQVGWSHHDAYSAPGAWTSRRWSR